MKYSIDLTKDNFNKVCFSEAQILDFYCPYKLPNNIEFTVWGATLLLAPYWEKYTPQLVYTETKDGFFPNDDDYYVSGVGTVKMSNLAGGEIDFSPFESIKSANNTTSFAKNHDGSFVTQLRKWPFNKTKELDEYLWEISMTWPHGGCVLRLFSNSGIVSYEFDTDDMIPAEKYIKNTSLYGFDEKKLK